MGIRAYLKEQNRKKQTWIELEKKNQVILDDYNPAYRYYAECLGTLPIEKKVIYEVGNGKQQYDILSALFGAFSKRPDFVEYQHIWVLHRKKDYDICKKAYKDYDNVEIWFMDGEAPQKYYRLLAVASYLFQGGAFPACFVKREEQTYVNVKTFAPDKVIGYEGDNHPYKLANQMHNLLMADVILVKDDEICNRLCKAFKLAGIYEGKILISDAKDESSAILENLLDGKNTVKVLEKLHTEKQKILFYAGGMAMNGVTEALLALLKSLDYDKYDVTVFCWLQDGTYSYGNIARIDKRARVLVSRGTDPFTREEQLEILYLKKYGINGKEEEKNYQKSRRLVKRAALRRFGNTSFDVAIDFSGYAAWVPLMFLEIPVRKRLIWEHQDLKKDFTTKNGRELGNKDVQLNGLLSVYCKFDGIVAVNRELMELNRKKLGNDETYEKFLYATNLIDAERLMNKIRQAETESVFEDKNGKKYLVYDSEQTALDGVVKMLSMEREPDKFRFVTMGRLSQEKNHQNLICAFQKFLKDYPGSQLFLIGKGVLEEELKEFVIRNGMERNVIFTGNLSNPYLLMKHCDCFVFPSYYEGQGLVVLEARMLHMPIVMSDYDVAPSVCVENGQYMITTEEESILQGLLAYAHGEVPVDYEFDIEKYNQKSIEEFYQVLEE